MNNSDQSRDYDVLLKIVLIGDSGKWYLNLNLDHDEIILNKHDHHIIRVDRLFLKSNLVG
jgi:hypothetical protein